MKTLRASTVLAILAVMAVFAFAFAYAGQEADDAKAIQGTWQPVKGEVGGTAMKEEVLKIISMKLEGGKYEVKAENMDKGTYKIDPSAKPKTIDVAGVEGPNAGKTLLAIYELDGDTLRICYGLGGSPRPKEFKSPAGTPTLLLSYERKKKENVK
jgi:uncharacterized protein (TIGR03067 family)